MYNLHRNNIGSCCKYKIVYELFHGKKYSGFYIVFFKQYVYCVAAASYGGVNYFG